MSRAVAVAVLAACMCAAVVGGSEVWPQPQTFTQGTTVVSLDPTAFTIACPSSSPCPNPLPAAFKRYMPLIFINTTSTDPLIARSRQARRPVYGGSRHPAPKPAVAFVAPAVSVSGLTVIVDADAPLNLDVNESYTLDVFANGTAVLKAQTQWGALRGLESFSQLVEWNPAGGATEYTITNATISIKDEPRFAWRGMLLDSARHYLSLDTLFRTIDAMSYNKFNVMHWHVVDDESWPIVSKTYPKFSESGAYTPQDVYQPADVQQLVAYAAERGIMVIPEFDMPAHASIWGAAYPDLVVTCDGGQTLLDPTGPVYDVLENLLKEYSQVFTQPFVHLGGDEVETMKCWDESAKVQAFAKAHNLNGSAAVRSYFEGRVQDIVRSTSKRSVVWEEVFDGNYNVSMDTVVNVWLSASETASVVKSGRNAVHSYGWYLDQQTPPGGTHYFWQDTWQNFYLNEPVAAGLTPAEEARILGGEGSMWSEQVDDVDIDVRIWPRACATAERLWSAKDFRDTDAAFPRISHQRCRMVQRGIDAGPLRPSSTYGYCNTPTA